MFCSNDYEQKEEKLKTLMKIKGKKETLTNHLIGKISGLQHQSHIMKKFQFSTQRLNNQSWLQSQKQKEIDDSER